MKLELGRHYTPSQHDTNSSLACSDAFTHSVIKSACQNELNLCSYSAEVQMYERVFTMKYELGLRLYPFENFKKLTLE